MTGMFFSPPTKESMANEENSVVVWFSICHATASKWGDSHIGHHLVRAINLVVLPFDNKFTWKSVRSYFRRSGNQTLSLYVVNFGRQGSLPKQLNNPSVWPSTHWGCWVIPCTKPISTTEVKSCRCSTWVCRGKGVLKNGCRPLC